MRSNILAVRRPEQVFAALQILVLVLAIWLVSTPHLNFLIVGADGSSWADTINIYRYATTVHDNIRTFTNNETYSIDVTVEIISNQSSIQILKHYKLSANGTNFIIISEGAVTQSKATYYGLNPGKKLCFILEARPTDTAAVGETATVQIQISYPQQEDTPPTCLIVDPVNEQTLSGVHRVKVSATDDKRVTTVELSINTGTWINITGNFDGTNYFYDWDTTKVSDGSHILDARATDNATQTTNASQVTINVDNPWMHVESISFTYAAKKLNIIVTIYSDTGTPLRLATVYMNIRYPSGSTKSVSTKTNTQGVATYLISNPAKGTYTVTVTNVVHTAYKYDPGANKETTDTYTVT
jgi:hypothetical protein